jgi:hypothetical protein
MAVKNILIMDTWKECAWFKCRKRFEPSKRSNRFCRADGPSHEGARFCSPACRQKAYRLRSKPVTKSPEGTTPLRTVTRPQQRTETKQEFSTKNGHARRLLSTRAGKIVPDTKWPDMYRIKWRGGALSDMVNYSRAANAVREATDFLKRKAA